MVRKGRKVEKVYPLKLKTDPRGCKRRGEAAKYWKLGWLKPRNRPRHLVFVVAAGSSRVVPSSDPSDVELTVSSDVQRGVTPHDLQVAGRPG